MTNPCTTCGGSGIVMFPHPIEGYLRPQSCSACRPAQPAPVTTSTPVEIGGQEFTLVTLPELPPEALVLAPKTFDSLANHTIKMGYWAEFKACMFDEVEAGPCLMCDKMIMADKAYGPKQAGTIQMSFGYGSPAHDVLGYDGFICDQCAMPFREKMLAQTIVRMQKLHDQAIADGVQFATDEDLKSI